MNTEKFLQELVKDLQEALERQDKEIEFLENILKVHANTQIAYYEENKNLKEKLKATEAEWGISERKIMELEIEL